MSVTTRVKNGERIYLIIFLIFIVDSMDIIELKNFEKKLNKIIKSEGLDIHFNCTDTTLSSTLCAFIEIVSVMFLNIENLKKIDNQIKQQLELPYTDMELTLFSIIYKRIIEETGKENFLEGIELVPCVSEGDIIL